MVRLVKALALGTAAPTTPAILDDLAQTCFAGPVRRQFLDTHQPLQERIRAIDPRFNSARIAEVRAEVREDIARRQQTTVAELERREAAAAALRKRAAFVRETVSAAVVMAKAHEVPAAEDLAAVASVDDARAVLIALLLNRQPEAKARQRN